MSDALTSFLDEPNSSFEMAINKRQEAETMANELKPCLAAFIKWTKQHHANWNLSPVHINGQFSKFMDPDTDTAWLGFEAAWNTRPAAPVEGLDTALCIIQGDYEERGIVLPVGTELVTRSQAEAIVAAERAMRKYAEERIIQSERELKEARANNAALTARVKELEASLKTRHTDDMNDMVLIGMARDDAEKRSEALETQLAAARKALEDVQGYVREERTKLITVDPDFFAKYEVLKKIGKFIREACAALEASHD